MSYASRSVGLPTGENPVGRSTRTAELVLQPFEGVRDRNPGSPTIALEFGGTHFPPSGVLRETVVRSLRQKPLSIAKPLHTIIKIGF